MIRIAALAALLLAAACGASGPPEPFDTEPERELGIEISGTAEIGITGGGF
ncbi:hypothetical protein ILP92_01110 [Maribius pontilimi]|uniref:Argininosuccinate lyase n=1 Tax=Palleronia pontilimi TaxID=1964209 RepID=A0A934IEN8_9RHOB|nr:hypothetical protein [Palleronia pontilimi]MBJ3761351.1 hypothetical protein [Palleronia pontilimi]